MGRMLAVYGEMEKKNRARATGSCCGLTLILCDGQTTKALTHSTPARVKRRSPCLMNAPVFATIAILCLALGIWTAMVGANPKRWRLQWLDTLGMLDTDTTREDRRLQEGQLRIMAFTLLFLLALLGVSCAFWSLEQMREGKRTKTTAEREMEYLRRRAEDVRNAK